MNVVFLGGGSFRTLPIVRGVWSDPRIMAGGEVRLVDFNLARAETVGRLLRRTPEYARSGCTVTWTDRIERALPGADVVSVSFPVGSHEVNTLSEQACRAHGLFGSDQLSVSGAFRAVTGGVILHDMAVKMEKTCPGAWLVDYANPVAVYSGLVNNHTRIRALGICGGFINHRWDLTRLLFGRDEYLEDYKVAVAGVNHCSLLLRGTYRGRDVYALMDRAIRRKGWTPCRIPQFRHAEKSIRDGLKLLAEMRRRFGLVLFSTEGDGLAHIFFDDYRDEIRRGPPDWTLREIRQAARQMAAARLKADAAFRAHLGRELDAAFWATAPLENPLFAAARGDATVSVLRGLSGVSREWLVASVPNRGAIRGFKARTVVEHSMVLDRDGIHPEPDLEVPDCFHGLMSALATHQTLLGDAIAARDPRMFAHALYAYPLHQNERQTKRLWKALLKIHRREMPAVFQKAADYF